MRSSHIALSLLETKANIDGIFDYDELINWLGQILVFELM